MVRSKKRKRVDTLEQAIEAVLVPGSFISYNAAWPFVNDAREVSDDIGKLIEKEPERATRLFEIFIAACHEKVEEIDDSGGSFGMLVDDLFRGWIQARQAAGADREETAKSLLAWMKDDPYGLCHYLDREAVKVLDRKGLDTFVCRIRLEFESAMAREGKDERSSGHARRRWGGVLKTLLAARRDVDAYINLCKQTELGAKECKTIAEMFRRRRRPEEALSWVERGLELARSESRTSFGEHELGEMKRALQAKLGRPGDALKSAWSEFQAYPSTFKYKELMRYVPVKEKKAWHKKAMEASEKGDLSSQIELWLDKKEMGRLVSRLRRATDEEMKDLSHYRSEPVARKIERSHPGIAARLYLALCMRIVNAGKSKYYDAALGNLEQARKCYAKAGLEAEWEAVVTDIRERHFRKKRFMTGFEEIATSGSRRIEPPFLDRAKARWKRKSQGK